MSRRLLEFLLVLVAGLASAFCIILSVSDLIPVKVDRAVLGLLTGLFVMWLLDLTRKAVMPWYQDKLYQDAKIEGVWLSEITFPEGEKNKHRMQLDRVGYTVTGRTTCYEGYSEGNTYDLNGTVRNLIFTCTYRINDPRRFEGGSMALMLVNDGKMLKGQLSFYDEQTNSMQSTNCEWTRDL
jgi:hypothetical protein